MNEITILFHQRIRHHINRLLPLFQPHLKLCGSQMEMLSAAPADFLVVYGAQLKTVGDVRNA